MTNTLFNDKNRYNSKSIDKNYTFSWLFISLTTKSYVDSLTDCTKLISVSVEEESFSEKRLFMTWTTDEIFNEEFDSG